MQSKVLQDFCECLARSEAKVPFIVSAHVYLVTRISRLTLNLGTWSVGGDSVNMVVTGVWGGASCKLGERVLKSSPGVGSAGEILRVGSSSNVSVSFGAFATGT